MKNNSSRIWGCCSSRAAIILISSATLFVALVSVVLYGVARPTFKQIHQCYRGHHRTENADQVDHYPTSDPFSRQQTSRFDPFHFTTTMKFSEHDDYQDLSHAHDYLWQDLLTENGGFLIKLDEEGVAHRHGIGMFHQLHCLQMIRRALQNRAPAEGNGRNRHMRHGFREDEDDGHDPELHMLHCFDYLRQSVLCLAEDTIEPPKKDALGRGVIDGMIVHQCRDNRPLYEMARRSPPYYLKGTGELETGYHHQH